MITVYMDGVFDLFHFGHTRAIKQCYDIGYKNRKYDEDVRIIIGVISDEDTQSYKREPVFTLEQRTEIINSLKYVDYVISPAPLVVSKDFIKENGIDIVVHGFADDEDYDKQKHMHKELIDMGIFERIKYTTEISTTEIMNKIKTNY